MRIILRTHQNGLLCKLMKTPTIEKCVKATGALVALTAAGFLAVPLLNIYTSKIHQGANEFHDQYVVISAIALLLVSVLFALGVVLFLYSRRITLLIQSKIDH